MAKYLDWGGLQTFWAKIKTWTSNYAKITTSSGTTKITIGESDITPITSITAGDGLNTTSNDTGTDGGTITGNSGTLYLTKSGVTAADYGPSTNVTPAAGATFDVPYLSVDKYGRVTSASTKTVKMPDSISDTMVNVTLGTTTKAYLLGTSTTPTSTAAGSTAIADTGVYLDTTAGDLHATTFNGYTLAGACAKGVVTSISSDSNDLPTVTAIKNYISNQLTDAAMFQGVIKAGTSLTSLPSTGYKKGQYWIVGTASVEDTSTTPSTWSPTYAGQICEVGDTIFCVKDYASGTASNNDFTIIQTNIEIITDAEINGLT